MCRKEMEAFGNNPYPVYPADLTCCFECDRAVYNVRVWLMTYHKEVCWNKHDDQDAVATLLEPIPKEVWYFRASRTMKDHTPIVKALCHASTDRSHAKYLFRNRDRVKF